ncbi:hypothetical protein CMV00_18230 [Elizabethkingia anophelis]|nr:hypothetical protein [Elizabethkingia anophelis]
MEITIGLEQIVNGMIYVLLFFTGLKYYGLIHSLLQENKNNKIDADELYVLKKKYNEAQIQLKKLSQEKSQLEQTFEKFTVESSRLPIIEKTEKRAQELIDQMNLLDENLTKMQKEHETLLGDQKELHKNLLREHHLLNQYFQTYS